MDQRAREYIGQSAELILKKLSIETPVENMEQVVVMLGGRLDEVEMPMVSRGIFRLDGEKEAFAIAISKNQSRERCRFAIAKELGNLFLHMGYMSDWDLWDNYDKIADRENHAQHEFQSNEFAANFMMPRRKYLEFVEKHAENGEIDACAIGAYFGVPESVASIRGKLVGALKWV